MGHIRPILASVGVVAMCASCGSFGAADVEADAGAAQLDGSSTDASDAGLVDDPTSVLSPSSPDGALAQARPADWVIAALGTNAVIRYTTDGSEPSPASASAVGKVTLPSLADGTQIKWTVDPSTTVQEHRVRVDTGRTTETDFVIEDVRFDNERPITSASSGTEVRFRARLQIWSRDGCSGCIQQLIYGFDSVEGCAWDQAPGVYPGKTEDVTLTVKAPATPGVHAVRVAIASQASCAQARAQSLSNVSIAALVVAP